MNSTQLALVVAMAVSIVLIFSVTLGYVVNQLVNRQTQCPSHNGGYCSALRSCSNWWCLTADDMEMLDARYAPAGYINPDVVTRDELNARGYVTINDMDALERRMNKRIKDLEQHLDNELDAQDRKINIMIRAFFTQRPFGILLGMLFGFIGGAFIGFVIDMFLPRAAFESHGTNLLHIPGQADITQQITTYDPSQHIGYIFVIAFVIMVLTGITLAAIGALRSRPTNPNQEA
jgi:hypothetical protein